MKAFYVKELVGLAALIGIFLVACNVTSVEASIPTMPWSTTFDCAEQDQTSLGWPSCDGLVKSGDGWAVQPCAITSAANYSGGRGGRGTRSTWLANNGNSASACGEPAFNLPGRQPELWARWYQRYQPGWKASAGIKNFYIGPPISQSGDAIYFNTLSDGLRTVANGTHIVQSVNNYFANEYGGGTTTSNGAWVCNETHWKVESTSGGTDAQIDWWMNGKLYLHSSNTTLGSTVGYQYGSIPSNGETTGNPLAFYIDIDDIEISTTGRIGCLGGTDQTPPAAPSNLRIQ